MYSQTSLISVLIPATLTSVGEGLFAYCSDLTTVTIANGVTGIGDYVFFACGRLTNVTVPASVTSIGSSAFGGDSGLVTLTIPGSVRSIGDYAFQDCLSLTGVYFKGNAPMVGASVFIEAVTQSALDATAYYLPGTAGWTQFSANTGLPAVLWNPLFQTGDGSFGVSNNQFGFNITGTTNIPIVVQACSNMACPVWIPLQTITLTNGLVYFSDPQWTNYPGRYYYISAP